MAFEGLFLFLGIVAIVIVIAVFAFLAEKKRRQALADTAQRLGLQFHPGGLDDVLARFGDFEAMNQGLRRRTRNAFAGIYRGVEVRMFDFIYETESRDSKGNRTRQTHHVSVAIATTDASWPKLTMVPENIGHKLFDALGGDDIDFESTEFSKKFWVKSNDRKFAYDILHPRTMELLLAAEWKKWQLQGPAICVWQDQRRLQPNQVQPVLDRLVDFLDLTPSFRRPARLAVTPRPNVLPGAATVTS